MAGQGLGAPVKAANCPIDFARGTHWFVFDRQTGEHTCLEQSEFEQLEVL